VLAAVVLARRPGQHPIAPPPLGELEDPTMPMIGPDPDEDIEGVRNVDAGSVGFGGGRGPQ